MFKTNVRVLVLFAIVLLGGGCTTPADKALIENVAGVYEGKDGEITLRLILLDNGKCEEYIDGGKQGKREWVLSDKEVHVRYDWGLMIYRINPNGSLTWVAEKRNGRRKDYAFDLQITFNRIT